MIYNYAKATDGTFLVTGVDQQTLYGLIGFKEEQAREIAFHLNCAYDRGQSQTQNAIKKALGIAALRETESL